MVKGEFAREESLLLGACQHISLLEGGGGLSREPLCATCRQNFAF